MSYIFSKLSHFVNLPQIETKSPPALVDARTEPRPERQRGLWSFLTWSFFLANVLTASELMNGSAHAASTDGDANSAHPSGSDDGNVTLGNDPSGMQHTSLEGTSPVLLSDPNETKVAVNGMNAELSAAQGVESPVQVAALSATAMSLDAASSWASPVDGAGSPPGGDTGGIGAGGHDPGTTTIIEIIHDGGNILGPVGTIVDTVTAPIVGAVGDVVYSVVPVVNEVVNTVTQTVASAVDTVDHLLGTVTSAVSDTVPAVVSDVAGIVTGIADAATGLADHALDTASNVVSDLTQTVSSLTSSASDVVDAALNTVTTTVSDTLPALVSDATGLVTGVADTATTVVDHTLDTASNVVSDLGHTIDSAASTVTDTASTLVSDAGSAVSNLTDTGPIATLVSDQSPVGTLLSSATGSSDSSSSAPTDVLHSVTGALGLSSSGSLSFADNTPDPTTSSDTAPAAGGYSQYNISVQDASEHIDASSTTPDTGGITTIVTSALGIGTPSHTDQTASSDHTSDTQPTHTPLVDDLNSHLHSGLFG